MLKTIEIYTFVWILLLSFPTATQSQRRALPTSHPWRDLTSVPKQAQTVQPTNASTSSSSSRSAGFDAQWKNILATHDTNRDGMIELSEVDDPKHPAPPHVSDLFRVHAGGDLKMSKAEFYGFLSALNPSMQKNETSKNTDTGGILQTLIKKGSYGNFDIGHKNFDQVVKNSTVLRDGVGAILKRECSSCQTSHKLIYYKRIKKFPPGFSIYDTLLNTWASFNNVLNNDFELYSTFQDLINQENKWQFCNYDDQGIGFPRDCGKQHSIPNQWTSLRRQGQLDYSWSLYTFPPEMCGEMPCQYCNDAGCCTSDIAGTYCKRKHPDAHDCPGPRRCQSQKKSYTSSDTSEKNALENFENAANFRCNNKYDWLMYVHSRQPPQYNQISLTDPCRRVNHKTVCNSNPKYGGQPNVEEAIRYCKERCAKDAECTAAVVQEHHNGHQICLTYKLNPDDYHSAISYSKHHQNGSVCIKSKIIRGQISNETNITDSNTTEKLSRSDMSPMVDPHMCGMVQCQYCDTQGCCTSDSHGTYCKQKNPDAQKCQEPRPCAQQISNNSRIHNTVDGDHADSDLHDEEDIDDVPNLQNEEDRSEGRDFGYNGFSHTTTKNNTVYVVIDRIKSGGSEESNQNCIKGQDMYLAGAVLYLCGVVTAFFCLKCVETFCHCCLCIRLKDENGGTTIVVTPAARAMTPLSTPKSNKLTISSPLPRLNIARSISKELDAAKKSPFANSPLGVALRKIGIRVEL